MEMHPDAITPYKKREFCNNIKCPIQLELNKHMENIINENNPDPENHIEKLETLAKFENTAWKFHRAISQQGFAIMKTRQ